MSKKAYGVNELREMFLSFFESKEHLRLPSFSLIPQNDQSLLLINSGMAPMKPYFKGEVELPAAGFVPARSAFVPVILKTSVKLPAMVPILKCLATSPLATISSMKRSPGAGSS